MKRIISFGVIICLIVISFLLKNNEQVQESMIYFPLDQTVSFNLANSSLNLIKNNQKDKYEIVWTVNSSLSEDAYLRQDISMLFVNGRLYDTINEWKRRSKEIAVQKKFTLTDTALLDVISFHHGELHGTNAPITSAQYYSAAKMYVIDSKYEPIHSFSIPKTASDEEWVQILTNKLTKSETKHLQTVQANLKINLNDYYIVPLTDFDNFQKILTDNVTITKANQIIGQLWEGLYKNYFLNIKKADGTTISPIGSTIPLLLLNKTIDNLIVSFETGDGDFQYLYQNLANS